MAYFSSRAGKLTLGQLNFLKVTSKTVIEHLPPEGEPRAFALVVHGLNTKPEIMHPIIKQLNARGVYALNVCLAGHCQVNNLNQAVGGYGGFKDITLPQWFDDITHAYSELKSINTIKPNYFVGYSTGALLGLVLIQQGKIAFDKLLLFAPAIALNKRQFLIRLIPFSTWVLPSFTPALYRAHRGTPVSVYTMLFELNKLFRQNHANVKLSCPALIFIDDKDELVSSSGIKGYIRQQNLYQWQVLPVNKSLTLGFHHMLTQESYVGRHNWQSMWQSISKFII